MEGRSVGREEWQDYVRMQQYISKYINAGWRSGGKGLVSMPAILMGGTWNLVYTTEKEVLSLIGDPGWLQGCWNRRGSLDLDTRQVILKVASKRFWRSSNIAANDLNVLFSSPCRKTGIGFAWYVLEHLLARGSAVYQKIDVGQGTLGNSALAAFDLFSLLVFQGGRWLGGCGPLDTVLFKPSRNLSEGVWK